MSTGQAFGAGVYTSPHLDTSLQYSGKEPREGGREGGREGREGGKGLMAPASTPNPTSIPASSTQVWSRGREGGAVKKKGSAHR